MGTNTVVVAVVLARFIVPLFIPKYPLPAILVALVLDAADQTIFSWVTNDPLPGYQSYDKALDVYYLAIAYITTMRIWRDPVAFQLSRFLYLYRLVGVTLFELTHHRWLLLVFPNTFEYFFDVYEAIRTKWNPLRLTATALVGIAAFIWIFIKLPQEWWIHVAQLDFTEFMRRLPGRKRSCASSSASSGGATKRASVISPSSNRNGPSCTTRNTWQTSRACSSSWCPDVTNSRSSAMMPSSSNSSRTAASAYVSPTPTTPPAARSHHPGNRSLSSARRWTSSSPRLLVTITDAER